MTGVILLKFDMYAFIYHGSMCGKYDHSSYENRVHSQGPPSINCDFLGNGSNEFDYILVIYGDLLSKKELQEK
jgi:hypothetical protein